MNSYAWRVDSGGAMPRYYRRIEHALWTADWLTSNGATLATVTPIYIYTDDDGRKVRAPFASVYEGQAGYGQ